MSMNEFSEPLTPSPQVDLADIRPIDQTKPRRIIAALILFLVVSSIILSCVFVIIPHVQAVLYLSVTGAVSTWNVTSKNWWYGGSTEVVLPNRRYYNSQMRDQDLLVVPRMYRVETLDLHASAVTDAGLTTLSKLPDLKTLHLGRLVVSGWAYPTEFTAPGITELTKLKKLTTLSLDGHRLSDECYKLIGTMDSLETLDLSDTGTTDAQLEYLKGLKNLKVLYLEMNKVTPQGVANLRRQLPKIVTIEDGIIRDRATTTPGK